MNKFNNSIAIQNIGVYGGGAQSFVGNHKSRNVNPGTFKTTASIGSTKGIGRSMGNGTKFEGTMKSNALKQSTEMIHAKKSSG